MNLRTNMILFITFLCFFCTGCGADDTVYLEQTMSDQVICEQDTEYVQGYETEVSVPGTEKEHATSVCGTTETISDTCYVYICGAILHPGVYEVPLGSRIYEVVYLAGGLTEEACKSSVNQAEPVYDGQMIFIPTVEEAEAGVDVDAVAKSVGDSDTKKKEADGRVNINTATLSELMTLSGIGQTKAERILAYRDTHGDFASVEEIMNVDGIKEGLYNRIKDDIRVK